MEEDMEATLPGQWVGFYCDGTNNPTFFQLNAPMTSFPMANNNLPLTVNCFMIGTPSRCLCEQRHFNHNFISCFHHVNITYTIKGPKKQEKKEETTFFYDKETTLSWDPNWWQLVEGYRFLNYTTKFG